jgi:tetratricopeptide (TPR) repeat protein
MECQNEELTALQQAYARHPDDQAAALHLAQQYSDLGWYNEALEIYRAAVDRAPDDTTLLLEYGNTAYKKGDVKTAIMLFERLAEYRPDRMEGWNNLGIARSDSGDTEGAFFAFSRVLELEPENPGALLNMGNYLFEKKDFEAAREHFKKACSTRVDFPDAWYNLGNVYIELEQYTEARIAFEKALRYRREFPSALKNLGWVNEQEGRFVEAEHCYAEALLLNKADAHLHVNIGNVNLRLKKYDDAKKSFLKAVRLAPNDLHGWMGLRGYALAKGDVGTFLRATMAVLGRLSDEVLSQSIEILYELNQIDKADALLLQAARLGRSSDLLDCMRLLLYQRTGDHRELVPPLLTRLSSIADPSEALLKGLARYHLLNGDYDNAVAVIGRIHHPDVAAKGILWRAMIGQGRASQVKSFIREYMAENPQNYDAYFLLATIEVQRGNLKRAEILLVHALECGFSNMEEIHANEKLHELFETMTGRKLVEDA